MISKDYVLLFFITVALFIGAYLFGLNDGRTDTATTTQEYVDPKTGCEYFQAGNDTFMRIDKNGNQLGCRE